MHPSGDTTRLSAKPLPPFIFDNNVRTKKSFSRIFLRTLASVITAKVVVCGVVQEEQIIFPISSSPRALVRVASCLTGTLLGRWIL